MIGRSRGPIGAPPLYDTFAQVPDNQEQMAWFDQQQGSAGDADDQGDASWEEEAEFYHYAVEQEQRQQRRRAEQDLAEKQREDQHRLQAVDDVQGAWVNVDCPGEQYLVVGQQVTRTDHQGTRQFSLCWDKRRRQLQWGPHGRLYLTHVADGLAAWVPAGSGKRTWRWQRLQNDRISASNAFPDPPLPPPPAHTPAAAVLTPAPLELAPASSSYGAWRGFGNNSRRPRANTQQQRAQPYLVPVAPQHRPPNWQEGRGSRPQGPGWRGYKDYRTRHGNHRYYNQHHRGLFGGREISCGLRQNEVFDLLFREITPEDYETLLRLDETVAKPTAAAESVDMLPEACPSDFMGGSCSVCISAFEADENVTSLPCQHFFHRQCITRWLKECKRACPLCGDESLPKA